MEKVSLPENIITMKTISIFCSARDVDDKYVQQAQAFCELMVAHGYDLVWGGSDTGMMKTIADTVEGAGGKLIGVSWEFFREVARKNTTEMIIAPTLGDRKRLLLERGDAIVCLVGGTGTLDEITEILDLKKLDRHQKPIVILNSFGFYDGLKMQLTRMHEEHFFPMSIDRIVHFANTPEEAIAFIDNLVQK
jgi:uncharacterized protein (TIGR00730 family)